MLYIFPLGIPVLTWNPLNQTQTLFPVLVTVTAKPGQVCFLNTAAPHSPQTLTTPRFIVIMTSPSARHHIHIPKLVTGCTPNHATMSGQDCISNLVIELKIHIFSHLSTKDVIQVRLTSRSWAIFGAEHLFKDGVTIRPQRNDMQRLKRISEHALISLSVKSLTIYTGDVDPMPLVELICDFAPKIEPLRRIFLTGNVKKYIKVHIKIFSSSQNCTRNSEVAVPLTEH